MAAAAGVGVVSGLLVREGAWARRAVGDTTYPPYWWAELAAGLVLLVGAAGWRLRSLPEIAVATALTTITAVVVAMMLDLDLIRFL